VAADSDGDCAFVSDPEPKTSVHRLNIIIWYVVQLIKLTNQTGWGNQLGQRDWSADLPNQNLCTVDELKFLAQIQFKVNSDL
jgi:hypothetical protein